MTEAIPAAARESAEQVVTELYQLHRLGLIGMALVLTGDRPTAEDVVQEAFAGLYRAMPRLADPDKALGYVRASVINGCRLAHRARTRSLRLHGQFRPDQPVAWSAESAVLAREESRLALQAVARGVSLKGLVLYEPPFIEEDGHPPSLDMRKSRLDQFVAADDRAGAVRFFMTDIFGAPKPFVAVMPLIMRSAWKKNQSVAHTLPYDLTLLEDWSILRERSRSVTVPTLVIGGEKSPAPLKDAVATVASALPNARRMYLRGQNHNFSAPAVAPVIIEFFSTLPRASAK